MNIFNLINGQEIENVKRKLHDHLAEVRDELNMPSLDYVTRSNAKVRAREPYIQQPPLSLQCSSPAFLSFCTHNTHDTHDTTHTPHTTRLSSI